MCRKRITPTLREISYNALWDTIIASNSGGYQVMRSGEHYFALQCPLRVDTDSLKYPAVSKADT